MNYYLENASRYDYVSNTQDRSFPRGMDVEVFSCQALEKAEREALQPSEREHVTLYMYRNPEQFRIGLFNYRLTVDTSEDFSLVQRLIETLYPNNPEFTLMDILSLLRAHPEWAQMNSHVLQKELR